jgi:Bacterial extracellular solute-binding proteins, family 5 Middle
MIDSPRFLSLRALQFVRPAAKIACIGMFVALCSIAANAQEKAAPPEAPVVEFDDSVLNETPFDLITIKAEAAGGQAKVFPIDFPGRTKPESPDPATKFIVKLINYPDRLYEVRWKDIERIDLYEELVLQGAKRRMQEKEYAAAFEHLNYLRTYHPDTPGLKELREQFLFTSASEMFTQKRYAHTLTVLEEYRKTFPNSRATQVLATISKIADLMIQQYMDAGDLKSAQDLIARLDNDFSNTPLDAIKKWKNQFRSQAEDMRRRAIQLRDAGELRKARELASSIFAIETDSPETQQLLSELIEAYPMIRVGVFQKIKDVDPSSLVDWPGRRAGALTSQPLFQFRNTGSEGGTYKFMFGSFTQSDDRKKLEMVFRNVPPESGINPVNVSQWMLRRAEPGSPDYRASWAAILDSIAVPASDRLEVRLRQPHVLPQALAQWQIREIFEEEKTPKIGLYARLEKEGDESSFVWTDLAERQPNQPIEIVERLYDDAKKIVSDLVRGEIEVIDQLYPSDAELLKNEQGITVERYALPTVHMLVPYSDHTFMSDVGFRRALLYSVNRETLLRDELLGGSETPGCQLISGPFPIGQTDKDPLSYAYNMSIPPFPYDRRLALMLVELAKKNLEEAAKKRKEPPPVLQPIRIGVPDFEAARTAAQAFVQQWQLLGVKAEVVILEQGVATCKRGEVDLLYISAAIWEPATDAERLLGEDGVAASSNPYIVQALARLRTSRNWREVRQSLQDLHTLINAHLPVLPLWQIADSFAYREGVKGIGLRPLSLYQDLEKWRTFIK